MRKVSEHSLPTVDKIIEVLPNKIQEEDKRRLKVYLSNLDTEYRKNLPAKLHEINIECIDRPNFFDSKKAGNLYNGYIRKEEKEIFNSFPTVKNINNAEICPICEGVLSTKVTLEHIIPKGKKGDFRFAILPINLIKCCGECNTSKHQIKSDKECNSEINPYAEDFRIENFFKVDLVKENGGISPIIKFSFDSNCLNHQRIKHFVNIYNIERTYNYRLKLEYQKIVSILSDKPYNYRRELLLCYLDDLKKTYKSNMDYEKSDSFYWIDQNFFGYLICEKLTNPNIINSLIIDINNRRCNPSELAFENTDFLKDFESVTNLEELTEFVQDNESDFRLYYKHLKNISVALSFPNLYKSKDKNKKDVIESILKYYLESNKDFGTFKQIILNIL